MANHRECDLIYLVETSAIIPMCAGANNRSQSTRLQIMRKIFVIGLILTTALVVTVGIVQARNPSKADAVQPRVGANLDLSSFAPFDFNFTPRSADGASVSQSEAVATAMRHSAGATASDGDLLSGVTVNAEYGQFTDHKMTSEPAGSDVQTLEYRSVLVWIVTFTGPTVGGLSDGPPRPEPSQTPLPTPSPKIVNTEAVVINATSGAAMVTFD